MTMLHNSSSICLKGIFLLIFLVPIACQLAYLSVKYEPTNTNYFVRFSLNQSLFLQLYSCFTRRHTSCQFRYESLNNHILVSNQTNKLDGTVYKCKNNASSQKVVCKKSQRNCTFEWLQNSFAILWNNTNEEYFIHPSISNFSRKCNNKNITFYYNVVGTTTQKTILIHSTSEFTTLLSTVSKSSLSTTTTNNSTNLDPKENKIPIILGTIGGVACLILIIVSAVIIIRRVQHNKSLLKSSSTDINALTNSNPNNDNVPTNNPGHQSRIKRNEKDAPTPAILTHSENDSANLDNGFKYFNTIVEDDYTSIDGNNHNSRVISTVPSKPETGGVIDRHYTNIKTKPSVTNNDTCIPVNNKDAANSTDNAQTRKTNHEDLIQDDKSDYSRLGQDSRYISNPYDGLLELNQEQSRVHQHELSPYTLAKPIPGSATLQVIDVGVCNDNLQPQTAASKHSVNTEHNYHTLV
ncbi:uncharacterized protein LOC131946571 [Physella acuta]|uniref:uncharacterized protein LOC131946571 n=1 Tax=Physella acuta TaxID=109671 RepID=UPI0027DBAB2A|nr:uncharacterized protein LOC131946571 [Physella acuta]